MWLVLTPKCNLRCIHCYEESTPNQQPKLALTLPFWKKIIEQGSQIGCKRVQFIGGEPLVYAEIFELMKHARSLGFEFVEIFTNGTLLTPEKVLRLKELDIHVAISLYSNAPLIHDQITTVPGSFEKTLRALRLLKGKDIPTRIGVIIMRQNQESIESTLELIKNLGFDAENSLDVVRPFGRGKSKDLIPSETTQHQFGLTSSPSFTTNRNDFLHHQFFNPCLAGKIAVDSTGNISPCIATSEITVGRTTQDLMDTVYGDALQTLWSISKDNIETCCVCEYRYACGDCRPLAQAETGDLYGKTGRCTYDPHTGQWHDKIQA